ncbi:MAG: hypothetical protein Q4A55_00165 [Aerococcus sp.]|nr:hypothetical protein [Aerococcus sp.]
MEKGKDPEFEAYYKEWVKEQEKRVNPWAEEVKRRNDMTLQDLENYKREQGYLNYLYAKAGKQAKEENEAKAKKELKRRLSEAEARAKEEIKKEMNDYDNDYLQTEKEAGVKKAYKELIRGLGFNAD